jgi:hypothetical protein
MPKYDIVISLDADEYKTVTHIADCLEELMDALLYAAQRGLVESYTCVQVEVADDA